MLSDNLKRFFTYMVVSVLVCPEQLRDANSLNMLTGQEEDPPEGGLAGRAVCLLGWGVGCRVQVGRGQGGVLGGQPGGREEPP